MRQSPEMEVMGLASADLYLPDQRHPDLVRLAVLVPIRRDRYGYRR